MTDGGDGDVVIVGGDVFYVLGVVKVLIVLLVIILW